MGCNCRKSRQARQIELGALANDEPTTESLYVVGAVSFRGPGALSEARSYARRIGRAVEEVAPAQ